MNRIKLNVISNKFIDVEQNVDDNDKYYEIRQMFMHLVNLLIFSAYLCVSNCIQ